MREFVWVLVAGRSQIERRVCADGVLMTVLDELEIVVMTVRRLPETQPHHELVRLGNLLLRFEIALLTAEAEQLARAVGALGLEAHLLRWPARAAQRFQPEARRYALLVDLQAHHAVPSVDAARLVMVVGVRLLGRLLAGAPSAPHHPQRDQNDQQRG